MTFFRLPGGLAVNNPIKDQGITGPSGHVWDVGFLYGLPPWKTRDSTAAL